MRDSSELVLRFFAAWAEPDAEEIRTFFHDDAVWVDGPQGVRRGAAAIATEVAEQLKAVGGVKVDVTAMVGDGRTVMVEQVSRARVGDTPVSTVVMAVFEFDADGRITQWREAYDLKSMTDQIEAASKTIHSGKPNS